MLRATGSKEGLLAAGIGVDDITQELPCGRCRCAVVGIAPRGPPTRGDDIGAAAVPETVPGRGVPELAVG